MADVAVIIPARDAAGTLPATLRALAAQRDAPAHEVIVVDDRSTDTTRAVAEAAGARVLETDSDGGPADARNLGVRATGAPLLAFTDADCEPDSGWLAAGVARLRDEADLVQGRILPTPGVDVGPFDRTLRAEHPSPLFETANLFVTREAFERAGGFRPHAQVNGRGLRGGPAEKSFGEDTLFGWAARRTGARVEFEPGALVYHAVFPRSAGGFVAERLRLRFFPALVRDVPELREHLTGGVFLSRRTAAFDLAAAGVLLALARRRPAALVLAAPYLSVVGPPWPPTPGRLRRLAANIAAEATGLGALAAGSVSARTPVL
jgi:glycosyltransferase involved in cell wall biosynthesis